MKQVTLKYTDAKGNGETMQVPPGTMCLFVAKDGTTFSVVQGEEGIMIAAKAAAPVYVRDDPVIERLLDYDDEYNGG